MSASAAASPPVVVFGDPEGIWGVAIGGPSPAVAFGQAGASGPVAFEPASLQAGGEAWTIESARTSLTVTPRDEQPPVIAGEAGRLELCRASGGLEGEQTSAGDGLAAVRSAALAQGRIDSIRLVAAWFPSGNDVALVASRPDGANGQDRDQISVVVLGEKEGVSVFDPRLSTTYEADGDPLRAGIELWLGETEDGDQHPRRVAGEAGGPAVRRAAPELTATPLRCHSLGEEGGGVYLLIRP